MYRDRTTRLLLLSGVVLLATACTALDTSKENAQQDGGEAGMGLLDGLTAATGGASGAHASGSGGSSGGSGKSGTAGRGTSGAGSMTEEATSGTSGASGASGASSGADASGMGGADASGMGGADSMAGSDASMPDPDPVDPEPMCGDDKLGGTEICDGDCPTIDDCESTDACLAPVLVGSAEDCDATCDVAPVESCASDDGCCPAGCKYPTDNDCSKSCGDGVTQDPETCEPTDPENPCPSSCDDGLVSTKDILTGTATECSAKCSFVPITTPIDDDGYCPPGANANNDNDCSPMCGNDVKESGEECDGSCPTSCTQPSDPCMQATVQGTGCQRKCVTTARTASTGGTDGCCPSGANANTDSDCSPMCGNNVVESGELCDGSCPTFCADPPGECVIAELQQAGTCNAKCVSKNVAASGSTKDGLCCGSNAVQDADCPSTCGNGVKEPGEECDDTTIRCSECKSLPTYTYPRCTAPAYEKGTCPQLSGQDVLCTSNQVCSPTCNDMTLFCPMPTTGSNKPTCSILCQFSCSNDGQCPGTMGCKDGFCGYN